MIGIAQRDQERNRPGLRLGLIGARVFAAVVRAVSAVRTLVCYECGAVGPGKDCGYENPILKAITGFPIAMEGKTAACAHLSPVGNIAAAACGGLRRRPATTRNGLLQRPAQHLADGS